MDWGNLQKLMDQSKIVQSNSYTINIEYEQ
jgi:hypothetical protein